MSLFILAHYSYRFIKGYRGIREKTPGEINGRSAAIGTIILIGLSLGFGYRIFQCLSWFQDVCRKLLEQSLREIFKQNTSEGIKELAYIVICSLAIYIMLKDCGQLEYWIGWVCRKIMRFLKWFGSQIMNLTAVLGFYYAAFYSGDSALSVKLDEKNTFLLVLAAFSALELLLYDVFELSTKCSESLGKKISILRKADSLWEGIKEAFLKETCPCPIREDACCFKEKEATSNSPEFTDKVNPPSLLRKCKEEIQGLKASKQKNKQQNEETPKTVCSGSECMNSVKSKGHGCVKDITGVE